MSGPVPAPQHVRPAAACEGGVADADVRQGPQPRRLPIPMNRTREEVGLYGMGVLAKSVPARRK